MRYGFKVGDVVNFNIWVLSRYMRFISRVANGFQIQFASFDTSKVYNVYDVFFFLYQVTYQTFPPILLNLSLQHVHFYKSGY